MLSCLFVVDMLAFQEAWLEGSFDLIFLITVLEQTRNVRQQGALLNGPLPALFSQDSWVWHLTEPLSLSHTFLASVSCPEPGLALLICGCVATTGPSVLPGLQRDGMCDRVRERDRWPGFQGVRLDYGGAACLAEMKTWFCLCRGQLEPGIHAGPGGSVSACAELEGLSARRCPLLFLFSDLCQCVCCCRS